MDVTNLILYLKSKITDQSIDQQMVSKAIRLLELGAVFTAQTFSALPSAAGRSGELWYVLYDGLYFSTGDYWIAIAQTSQSVTWAWGNNGSAALGDGTAGANQSSPVSVVGGFSDWCQISAGGSQTGAVRRSGSAWAWGYNGTGRLGDNTTTNRSSPVSVVGGFTDWCQASTGGSHTVAVRRSGSAWAWGYNGSGRLGDNTTTNRSSPVSVVGGFTDWCQINAAGGGSHTVAVRTSGSAWAWGSNNCGKLGDNTTTDRSSPVSVVGGFSDWCQISSGQNHSAAVRTVGSAWAWGRNNYGQIGDNTTTPKSSPVSVVGGFTDWCTVHTFSYHTLGLRSNGTIWAWGNGANGRLGDNSTQNKSSPVSIVGGFTDWCQVSPGTLHSLAVKTNGTAWSWGATSSGSLGINNTTPRSSPVSVVGGFTDWCQVAAGNSHSVAIRSKTL